MRKQNFLRNQQSIIKVIKEVYQIQMIYNDYGHHGQEQSDDMMPAQPRDYYVQNQPDSIYRYRNYVTENGEDQTSQNNFMPDKQSEVSMSNQNDLSSVYQRMKNNIKIVCRIKPGKVPPVQRQQSQPFNQLRRARVSRSNSRGSSNGRMLANGASNSSTPGNKNLNLDGQYDNGPASSRSRGETNHNKKPSRAYTSLKSTSHYIQTHTSTPRNRRNSSALNSEESARRFKGRSNIIQTQPVSHSRVGSSYANRRTNSAGSHPVLFYNKMLKAEAPYCIFTSRETSKYVVACDQPYSGKLLNESFNTVQDLRFLQNQPVQFKFDGVYDETSTGRQERLYQLNVRPIVHNFVEGTSATVLLFGPSDCGKTYTLKGGQGSERGIVPRAIEDILGLIRQPEIDEAELNQTPSFQHDRSRVFLKISVYMVYMDQTIDLLSKSKQVVYPENHDGIPQPSVQHYLDESSNLVVSRLVNLNERLVLCTEDFYLAIADAYRSRKELSYNQFNDKDLRKKSHFVVNLTLVQQLQDAQSQFMQLAQMNMIELSGSEQAVNRQQPYNDLRDTPVHEFVSKSFNSLSCHLMKLTQRKSKIRDQQELLTPETQSKLMDCLRSAMQGDCNILLINCVDPSPQMFEHCLPSLKFSASMRDQIQRRIKKYWSKAQKTSGTSSSNPNPGTTKLKKQKSRSSKTNSREITDIMKLQIQESNALLDGLKQTVCDIEYKLQTNQGSQTHQECDQFLQQVRQIIQDLGSLVQMAQQRNSGQGLTQQAVQIIDQLRYFESKLVNLQQRPPPSQTYGNGDHISVDDNFNNQDLNLPLQIGAQSANSVEQQQDQNSWFFKSKQNPSTNAPLQTQIDQFNTVDNRQVGNIMQNHVPFQQQLYAPNQLQDQTTSRSRSNSRSTRENYNQFQAQGSIDAQTVQYHRSMRTSFDDEQMYQENPVQIQQPNAAPQQQYPSQLQIQVHPPQQQQLPPQQQFQQEWPQPTGNVHQQQQQQFQQQQQQQPPQAQVPNPADQSYTLQDNFRIIKNKYKNLIQSAESQFTKVRNELDLPALVQNNDLPTFEQIRQQMPRIDPTEQDKRIMEEFSERETLYKTEDELVNDVQRLMMLQDKEGLKLRVLQLFRDRESMFCKAQTQYLQNQALKRDNEAQSKLFTEYEKTIAHNNKEYNRYVEELDHGTRVVETEIVNNLKDQMAKVNLQQETITQLEENLESLKKERDTAADSRQTERKSRVEIDQKMKEVEAENQKLKQNYDILKEHEMTVIRDCENKKVQETKKLEDDVNREKQKFMDEHFRAEKLQQQLKTYQENTLSMENDMRLQEDERRILNTKIDCQASEIVVLKEECSKLKQKQFEDIELIQMLRKEQDIIKKDRDEKFDTIQKHKIQLLNNEKSVDNQHQMFKSVQNEIKILEKDIETLRQEKYNLRSELNQQKDVHKRDLTNKDIVIQKLKEEIKEVDRVVESKKQIISQKDQELVSIKAHEYDKVDMIKQVAELECKIKIGTEELEVARKLSKTYEDRLEASQNDNQALKKQMKQQQEEIDNLNTNHDQNLDQFDTKFDDLHQKMEKLRYDNNQLRDKAQQLKIQLGEQDKEKLYWREKCRVAEAKGDEINQKIIQLETELRTILYERQNNNMGNNTNDAANRSANSLNFQSLQ